MPDEINPTNPRDSGPAAEFEEDGLPELDDATDLRVRELLSQVGHDAPMPPDVAARLDEVLAGLVAESTRASELVERAGRAGVAAPIDLDARRRRKRWTTGLVAAAAVAVVGVSVPALLDGSGSDGSISASTSPDDSGQSQVESDSADSATGGATGEDEASPGTSLTQEPPEAFADGAAPVPAAPGPALEVDPDQFRNNALAARETPAYDALARPSLCGPGPLDAAVRRSASVVPVRYDDQRGYLVFLDPAGKTQQVDLYLCPAGELERTITVPAP